MELLRELMRKAERNQMMTQTLSLHQLEHKHAPDPRQAEWNAQKAAGQWPGWKATGPPPKSVNPPPASSGRPPKMNYDPDDDPWAAVGTTAPKADPPVLQIFGNVQQGTPPINLPPAATAMPKSGFPEHSAAAMGTESVFPPAKASAPTAENSAAKDSCLFRSQAGPTKQPGIRLPRLKRYQKKKLGMAMVDAWMKALRGIEMSLRMKMNSLALSIFQQMSHRRGSQITYGEFQPQFSIMRRIGMTRVGTPAISLVTWTQLCLIQCMCKASSRGPARRSS